METTAVTGLTGNMIIAAIIFIAAYTVIFTEILHRAYAAIISAVVMMGVGVWAGFYPQERALRYLDGNTLFLLFGMMLMIAMIRPTGGFEYLAIRIARLARGSSILLFIYLCFAVSVLSMFLDNVTTVLIFAPLTVLITRLVNLNPLPYLMAEALSSNIGGVATLVGDPPNLLIGSAAHFSFNYFFFHLGPITVAVWITTVAVMLFLFRDAIGFQHRFGKLELDENKAISQPRQLKYMLFASGVIILLFFVHHHFHLYPAYVAFLGVAIALPLIRPHPEELLREVEWSVLVFFAGLFILVGGLESSGLLNLLGQYLAQMAKDPGMLLLTALLLMWIAAAISAIVDNIPFTVTMIPIVQSLEAHGVNVLPLWWALAMGAGFGGNGTHIGATANIICVAESERCEIPEARITPAIWLRKGLPTTFFSLIIASLLFVVFFDFFRG